jgi:hypothetical protein
MKSFLLGLTVFFAAALLHGTIPVSAASAGWKVAVASPVGSGGLTTVQDYTDDDEGYDDDDRYRGRRRYDDDGGRYPERRWNPRGYREYCFSCTRRCSYGGLCPPRCWGWWRYCRRGWED